MIHVRKSIDRGRTRSDWLDGAHTFSFGGYRDPNWMGFRGLRVLNEDVIAPGGGFTPHSHREMEILTWVVSGALAHRDDAGNTGVIRAGEAQRMTAGTGITHSEMNGSDDEPVHLLQIWLLPERAGLAPSHEQRAFGDGSARVRIADREGKDGALRIHADAAIDRLNLARGSHQTPTLDPGRHGWLQVIAGDLLVNGANLSAGDGAAVSDEAQLILETDGSADALWFDLA